MIEETLKEIVRNKNKIIEILEKRLGKDKAKEVERILKITVLGI
ncbi:MAG: hypothetical protein QXR27_06070 [Archaeoglobaceae archaeon]